MPTDIFKALPNSEVAAKVRVFVVTYHGRTYIDWHYAKQIQKTVYLPEEKIEWLDQQSKSHHAKPAAKVIDIPVPEELFDNIYFLLID